MKIKSYVVCCVVAFILLPLSAPLSNGICGDPPQWRTEFDETCAYTTDAMGLSLSELEALIVKCEKLQKTLEQLDESTRKVFLKRVLLCKNLYQYVLDTKKRTAEPIAK